MALTVEQLLETDFNELVMRNPKIAATYMALLDHAIDRAKAKGTEFIFAEAISCNQEGHVQGRLTYGKKD